MEPNRKDELEQLKYKLGKILKEGPFELYTEYLHSRFL